MNPELAAALYLLSFLTKWKHSIRICAVAVAVAVAVAASVSVFTAAAAAQ